ncbi:hypothetical protein FKM82_018595 [Ascaphus truei]
MCNGFALQIDLKRVPLNEASGLFELTKSLNWRYLNSSPSGAPKLSLNVLNVLILVPAGNSLSGYTRSFPPVEALPRVSMFEIWIAK